MIHLPDGHIMGRLRLTPIPGMVLHQTYLSFTPENLTELPETVFPLLFSE